MASFLLYVHTTDKGLSPFHEAFVKKGQVSCSERCFGKSKLPHKMSQSLTAEGGGGGIPERTQISQSDSCYVHGSQGRVVRKRRNNSQKKRNGKIFVLIEVH
jgi:hypothetical protein